MLGIGKDLMALEAFIRAQEVWDIGFTGLKDSAEPNLVKISCIYRALFPRSTRIRKYLSLSDCIWLVLRYSYENCRKPDACNQSLLKDITHKPLKLMQTNLRAKPPGPSSLISRVCHWQHLAAKCPFRKAPYREVQLGSGGFRF